MAVHQNAGDSIECSSAKISVRKIGDPFYIKIKGVKYFKYKSSVRSIVTITQELNPKEHIILPSSKLDLNDELSADVVEIYTINKRKFDVCSNFSHVHGIQCNDISDFTFAKIVIPWRYITVRKLLIA